MAVDANLTALIETIPVVSSALLTVVGDAIDLVISQPLLAIFVGIGIVGIGIRYGFRIVRQAKGLSK